MIIDTYKTIKNPSEGIYKEKGSKFISFAYPISSIEKFKEIKSEIDKKYYDARHRCFAYKLGIDENNTRSSDDGEPSNTAGKPILGQIKSRDLSNILIYVIRYFGGTLLGVSGLIQAYKSSAADALNNATVIKKILNDVYQLHFPYLKMNDIMRFIKDNNLEQSNQEFENDCKLNIYIRKKDTPGIIDLLKKMDDIEVKYLYTK